MIFTIMFDQFYNIIFGAIDKININDNFVPDVTGFGEIVGYSLYFFPLDMLGIIIGNFIFWYSLQLIWAVIEWAYKKIPGIN